jgi:hypothetical protein
MSDLGTQVWTGMSGATPGSASTVSGNTILVHNASGQSGGICGEGTFYGIYMSIHGTAFGNTVAAKYNVTGGVSSDRSPIYVVDGYRVAVSANNVFGFGDVTNPVENITLGNLGVGNTVADLSNHPLGNSTGQGVT